MPAFPQTARSSRPATKEPATAPRHPPKEFPKTPAVPPEKIYTEGPLSHEFPRTVSRLNEMRSKEYLALERRVVDTSLT